MIDTKLERAGTILMHDGKIYLDGFEADGCMCREVAIHALIWGIGQMQQELVALIDRPGGTDNTCIDLPPAVHDALGLPSPWDE